MRWNQHNMCVVYVSVSQGECFWHHYDWCDVYLCVGLCVMHNVCSFLERISVYTPRRRSVSTLLSLSRHTHTHTHSSGLMTSCTSDSHGVSLPVKLKYHRRCEKWTVMYVTVLVGSIQVNACGACHSSGLCTGGGNLCTYRQFYMGAARLCRRPSRLSDGW